jgi:hypothetical protein
MGQPSPSFRRPLTIRTAVHSLHAFEWLVLAQLPAMHILFYLKGCGWQWWTLGVSFLNYGPFIVILSLAGILLTGLGIGLRRRSVPAGLAYFAILRNREWWALTFRIWLGIVISLHLYMWLKLYVPFLNRNLLDASIWEFEQTLFGGVSPNIFLLELFKYPWALRGIDWAYPNLFQVGIIACLMFIPALPSRSLRLKCTTSYSLLWTSGGWLHVLLPAMGPCYWFPSAWKPFAEWLPLSLYMQAELLKNYQGLALSGHGAGIQLHTTFGVAAVPSMHNASQALLAMWAWRLNRWVGWGVWMTFAVIFLGSVITGWHYVVDALSGTALAAACYWGVQTAFRRSRKEDRLDAPKERV